MKITYLTCLGLFLFIGFSVSFPFISGNSIGEEITRATGEDVTIDIELEFDGPLGSHLDITLMAREIYVNNTLRTADELRSLYQASPDQTVMEFEEEVLNRVSNLTATTFQGDSFDMISGEMYIPSIDNSTSGEDDPVIYHIQMIGITDINRYMAPERASLIEEGRENIFITSLFLAGFTFHRTVGLVAQAGEIVNYHFPAFFDPLGDGSIVLELDAPDHVMENYRYSVTVDGTYGYSKVHFDFTISGDGVSTPVDEEIDGELIIDWKEIDIIGVGGEAEIISLRSDRSDLLRSAPPSMNVPSFIPVSMIRYAHKEGILTDEDLENIAAGFRNEIDSSIQQGLDDDSIEGRLTIDTGSDDMIKPVLGSDIRAIMGSDEPMVVSIGTNNDAVIDLLKGYEREDVVGLLNGGLRIYHELSPIYDDRFDVLLMAPSNIEVWGDPHVREEGTRKLYEYTPGRKLITSSVAPEYHGSKMKISGMIDIFEVRSMYFMDTEINIDADIGFDLSVMEFDSEDIELVTEMEYELDYLSSDMIRLLMKMEIIDREEIEDRIEGDFKDGIGDIIPDEEEFDVDILDSSLVFDGDTDNMNGDEPITLSIVVSTSFTVDDIMGKDGNGDQEIRNGIIPFHLDPLLPVRRFEKTIDLGKAKEWEMDLKISIPSGIGIKAWTGLEGDDHVKDLVVETDGGYPTVHLEMLPGEADRITVRVEVGGYVLFNNIGMCFGCCLLGTFLIFLILLLIIIKALGKKKKGTPKKDKKNRKEKAEYENVDEEEMSWNDV